MKGEVLGNEDELVDYTINSNLRLKNPNPAFDNDKFIDYYNGILKYYYQNEDDDNANLHKTTLQAEILNEPYALLPSYIFKSHRDLLVKDSGLNDYTNHPHGIINDGWNGNLNAKTLQSANLGFPQHIFSNNIINDAGETYTETKNAGIVITIPYTQRNTSGKYVTRLGDVTEYRNGEDYLTKHTISINGPESELTEQIDIKDNYSYVQSIVGKIDGVPKRLNIKYSFSDDENDISFIDENGDPLNLYGRVVEASSIEKKYVLSIFETQNSPAISGDFEDKYVDRNETTLKEALQAIYEMPLATFKYNREYESEDPYYKRYFGIVVERIAATKNNFASDAELTNKTAYDEVEYTYTDEEKASIAEYLNLVTDNPEQGMRTSAVIGILLKAAKETQERLLNLEVSTYGKDSPTLPGADTANPNFTDNNQKSTIAGLNRLVKALCREVFQDADPSNINDKGAWSEGSDNYSRLDLLDKEVNGADAIDDNKERLWLTEDLGTTYPDDASITETLTLNEDVVGDAANNDDFGREDAVKYPKENTYEYAKEDVDNFDGINDAINRIVAKLNQLTINVNGADDIKMQPRKLDNIRGTLATLLRDVYSDGTVEDVNSGIYVKNHLSRIDKILQDLYNFDLTYGETRAKDQTYNGRTLNGDENDLSADENTIGSFSSRSPEKINDIYNKASILDVIIELLSGNEKDLVKTRATPWKDFDNDERNHKINADNTIATTYDNTAAAVNNKISLNHNTVLERLDNVEKALTLIYSRLANKTDFTKDSARVGEGAYAGVTSIDDYMKYIRDNSGLCFDRLGLYADKAEGDARTDAAKNVVAENWVRAVRDTVTDFDMYDTVYDAIKRIKNSEMNLGYNNAKLGTDYDTYKIGNERITKDTYEALAPNGEVPTPEYTVTSDMKAILKLLYGADMSGADDSDNKTSYPHFNVANETNDNFKNSPSGVSVIDALYKMLYNVPKAYSFNAGTSETSGLEGTVDEIYSIAKGFDPANPKKHVAVTNSESPVADGHRNAFILQAASGTYRKNRIDILEDWVKSIYRYVGFGSTNNSNYFTGNLHLTFSQEENGVKNVYVNGKEYCDTSYNKEYIKNEGNYTLVGIALQSYYNTLKLEKVLGDDPNNYPVQWTYVPAANIGSISSKAAAGDMNLTANGVHAALDKLYTYIHNLDAAAVDIDNRLQSFISKTNQYEDATNDTIDEIQNEISKIGDKSDNAISSNTLWGAIEETNNRIVFESNPHPSLELVDNETVVKNDNTNQASDKIVSTAAMKAYVADIVGQLRDEYEAKCQQVKEQAIVIAYLKCNDITVISNDAIQIDHTYRDKDYIWRTGENPNVGNISINPPEKRFGELMCKVTISDFTDNVSYSAYFKYDPKTYSSSCLYKQDFFEFNVIKENKLTYTNEATIDVKSKNKLTFNAN